MYRSAGLMAMIFGDKLNETVLFDVDLRLIKCFFFEVSWSLL